MTSPTLIGIVATLPIVHLCEFYDLIPNNYKVFPTRKRDSPYQKQSDQKGLLHGNLKHLTAIIHKQQKEQCEIITT